MNSHCFPPPAFRALIFIALWSVATACAAAAEPARGMVGKWRSLKAFYLPNIGQANYSNFQGGAEPSNQRGRFWRIVSLSLRKNKEESVRRSTCHYITRKTCL